MCELCSVRYLTTIEIFGRCFHRHKPSLKIEKIFIAKNSEGNSKRKKKVEQFLQFLQCIIPVLQFLIYAYNSSEFYENLRILNVILPLFLNIHL